LAGHTAFPHASNVLFSHAHERQKSSSLQLQNILPESLEFFSVVVIALPLFFLLCLVAIDTVEVYSVFALEWCDLLYL
jgi:hypothetical protein